MAIQFHISACSVLSRPGSTWRLHKADFMVSFQWFTALVTWLLYLSTAQVTQIQIKTVLWIWQIYLNFYQRMGILPLKKRVNRDKCSFTTKQRMFGVFAIDEILCYRWTPFVGSRTLCHPGQSSLQGRPISRKLPNPLPWSDPKMPSWQSFHFDVTECFIEITVITALIVVL